METMKISGLLVVSILVAVAGTAGAEGLELGKREYDANCAACHGTLGRGDGPQAGAIKARVANLSRLTKSSNGAFPSQRIYAVIDGRAVMKTHGAREMPIWGDHYLVQANVFLPYEPERFADITDPANEMEAFVRKRILAVTEYVGRLQAK